MEWFTTPYLSKATLSGLPCERHLRRFAQNWRKVEGKARLVKGSTKPVWEYHISLLPAAAQAQLRAMQIKRVSGEKE